MFFSACGGDSTSKAEAFVKEKYPDAKILSYDETKKELGVINKECLNQKYDVHTATFITTKTPNAEIEILEIWTDNKNGAMMVRHTHSIEQFKAKNPKCFD